MASLEDLQTRVEVLERQETVYKLTIASLERADSVTAGAVNMLTDALNNPKTGLIVELDRFKTEVRTDRRVTMAFVGGLVIVINVLVPFVPAVVRAWFHVP